jgi:hypothetical protein
MWTETMNPARKLLHWLPELDFALFRHGYMDHGRDYAWRVQDCLGSNPGEHEIIFTHCVQADCETRVLDEIWLKSWDDVFLDFNNWKRAGEPEGYVWGTNWSNAYPGLIIVEDSPTAAAWSRRIGKPFFEVTLETDRIFLRLVFHDVRHRKLSDSTGTISAVTIPQRNDPMF